MHCCDDMNTYVFLTKGEQDQFMDENDGFMLETDETLSSEMEEFRKGYRNAIMQFQNKYNLRSRTTHAEPPKTNPTKELRMNTPSSSQPKKDNSARDATEKEKSKEESLKKSWRRVRKRESKR
jgi:hypothetical protein